MRKRHFLKCTEEAKHGKYDWEYNFFSRCIIDTRKPWSFFVLGDTNSCLSVISAKRQKIPIFHFEAGNRCFDQRALKINRKIVDHVSDINLTYSAIARDYLLSEGLPPDRVIKIRVPCLK